MVKSLAPKRDLLWQVMKKQTCFTRKFNGVTLSMEPMNISGQHKKVHCGLIGKGVGLSFDGKKARVVMSSGKARNPRKSVKTLRCAVGSPQVSTKIVRALVAYRPDMIPLVQKKAKALAKQARPSLH